MSEPKARLLEQKNRGMQFMQAGRYQDARSVFEQVCRKDHQDHGARYMLGIANLYLHNYDQAEACLRQVTSAMPGLADAHFMLGQALQAQEKREAAANSYQRALTQRPDMVEASYQLANVLAALENHTDALRYYQRTLELKPDHLGALTNLGKLHHREGEFDQALACYRRALRLSPDLDTLRGATGVALAQKGELDAGLATLKEALQIRSERVDRLESDPPAAARPAEDTPVSEDITIATTLAPRNLDNQRAALESWKQLGFHVVSINSAGEIAQLRPHFPDIEFITAPRDAAGRCGKPYVYFDDFLSYFRQHDDRICGIINSDIHLTGQALRPFLAREASDSFLFGCRLDVEALGVTRGRVFRDGFDYFFFDRKYLDIYPEDDFCLGLPWWDYWAVLVPLLNDVPVKKLISPVAQHIVHPINWDEENWKRYARKLASYLGAPGTLTPKMLGYCARYIVFLIERYATTVTFDATPTS